MALRSFGFLTIDRSFFYWERFKQNKGEGREKGIGEREGASTTCTGSKKCCCPYLILNPLGYCCCNLNIYAKKGGGWGRGVNPIGIYVLFVLSVLLLSAVLLHHCCDNHSIMFQRAILNAIDD